MYVLYLLEVLVVVDVLPLSGILESIAPYVLPDGIDDVRPLGSVDAKQTSQLTGQFVLDGLQY